MPDAIYEDGGFLAKREWPAREPQGKSAERRVMTDVVAACDLAEPARARRRALFHVCAALTQHHRETRPSRDCALQLLKISGLRIAKERFFGMAPA